MTRDPVIAKIEEINEQIRRYEQAILDTPEVEPLVIHNIRANVKLKRMLEAELVSEEALKKPYPSWVCFDCGEKYGRRLPDEGATWNQDTCGVCERETEVTEPRDFGHLILDWSKYERA